ncbi:GxxExxY protein [Patescibacteria group bacterium]|nr:GxxExxY protein [Patescibacteria group bacterium]MBU1472496.1 GxxExxY protein [Patescibacteria group bacterium]MBU2459547.1 GxxExxY protein [Patescibacteria group bacterium]MBU2543864.1 GxxExxY protein [Patescibacteria group bacterium]
MNTNKNANNIILPELSYKIMGALFTVHNELGPSLLEKYYQRALAKEFEKQGLKFKREIPVTLTYKNEPIGKYILDFIVEGKVVLETKAQIAYNPNFFKQTLAYLNETNLPLAILVNFRRPKLEYRRIVNAHHGENS